MTRLEEISKDLKILEELMTEPDAVVAQRTRRELLKRAKDLIAEKGQLLEKGER